MNKNRITTGGLSEIVGYFKSDSSIDDVSILLLDSNNERLIIPNTIMNANLPIPVHSKLEIRISIDQQITDRIEEIMKTYTNGMLNFKDFEYNDRRKQIVFKTLKALMLLQEQAKDAHKELH